MRMRILAFIEEDRVIGRILRHLGLLPDASRGPPLQEPVYEPISVNLEVLPRSLWLRASHDLFGRFLPRRFLPNSRVSSSSNTGLNSKSKMLFQFSAQFDIASALSVS